MHIFGATTGFDPVTLVNYGVLGVILIAAVFGYVWFRPAVDRMIDEHKAIEDHLRADKEKAEEQRDAALQIAQEKVVPLLASFVQTTQVLFPLLQQLLDNRPGPEP